jgi:hypothetical protein
VSVCVGAEEVGSRQVGRSAGGVIIIANNSRRVFGTKMLQRWSRYDTLRYVHVRPWLVYVMYMYKMMYIMYSTCI